MKNIFCVPILLVLCGISFAATVVDHTDDRYALGFTDSRKVARDSKGRIFIAYRKKFKTALKPRSHIFVAVSEDRGMSWNFTDRPIEDVGDFHQRVPSIAADSKDVIHVVWSGNDAGNLGANERQIKYAKSVDAGLTWTPWRNIASVVGYQKEEVWQENPVIYIDSANNIYVAWQGRDSEHRNQSQIKFIKSVDGGKNWKSFATLPFANAAGRPAIVAASTNSLHIVAYASQGQRSQLIWAQSNNAGFTWLPWKEVAPDENDQRNVSICADKSKALHVVWQERFNDSQPDQVYYASYNGKQWVSTGAIAENETAYQYFPSIRLLKGGSIGVVWTESLNQPVDRRGNPSPGQVVYIERSKEGWGEAVVLDSETNNVFGTVGVGNADRDVVWLSGPDNQVRGKIAFSIFHDVLP